MNNFFVDRRSHMQTIECFLLQKIRIFKKTKQNQNKTYKCGKNMIK